MMISSTVPEPICDIAAQLAAMLDPSHPKDCVWISHGSAMPAVEVSRVDVDGGTLFSTNLEKARRFENDASEDTLVDVLGYIEPKRSIRGLPIVVRAENEYGSVITEMACSVDKIADACRALEGHGRIALVSLYAVLLRRTQFLRLEAR